MDCEEVQQQLGQLADGELNLSQEAKVGAHVHVCDDCRRELEQLQVLIQRLESSARVAFMEAPAELWPAVEARLVNKRGPASIHVRLFRSFRRPLAAAGLMMLLGGGTLVAVWLSTLSQPAHASDVNYSILLDHLVSGVDAAVNQFLDFYRAEAIRLAEAESSAPGLRFALPTELPSGHKLEQVYRLRFGDSPGLAARYRLGDEPLVVFFHRPVSHETVPTHGEMPCIIGGRHGQRIEVGAWGLVHFTDPSTCHCVLSRLDLNLELPAVLAAIAPQSEAQLSVPERGQDAH